MLPGEKEEQLNSLEHQRQGIVVHASPAILLVCFLTFSLSSLHGIYLFD